MSIEVVQFLEMVREAHGTSPRPSPDAKSSSGEGETWPYYCVVCGGEKGHTIEEKGVDEVWRCCTCGIGKVFRVR